MVRLLREWPPAESGGELCVELMARGEEVEARLFGGVDLRVEGRMARGVAAAALARLGDAEGVWPSPGSMYAELWGAGATLVAEAFGRVAPPVRPLRGSLVVELHREGDRQWLVAWSGWGPDRPLYLAVWREGDSRVELNGRPVSARLLGALLREAAYRAMLCCDVHMDGAVGLCFRGEAAGWLLSHVGQGAPPEFQVGDGRYFDGAVAPGWYLRFLEALWRAAREGKARLWERGAAIDGVVAAPLALAALPHLTVRRPPAPPLEAVLEFVQRHPQAWVWLWTKFERHIALGPVDVYWVTGIYIRGLEAPPEAAADAEAFAAAHGLHPERGSDGGIRLTW